MMYHLMREDLTGQKLVCIGLLGTLPHIYASITRRVGKTILYLFSCFILLISDLESLGELCTYTRNHILYAFQCWYYQMIKGQEKFLLISPIPIPQFWMHACTIVTYRWKRELSFGLDSINMRFQDPGIAKIRSNPLSWRTNSRIVKELFNAPSGCALPLLILW